MININLGGKNMSLKLLWKNNTFNRKKYAWQSVDSCSDYK